MACVGRGFTAVTKLRILVVQHQANAGLGVYREQLRAAASELVIAGPVFDTAVPSSAAGFDAVIVLGGSMGPTDDEKAPWLVQTRELLRDAVAGGVPTLGICLGAQLLATALNGEVKTMPQGPEIGVCRVRVSDQAGADPLFGSCAGAALPAVQWHYLEVATLPEGAVVLGGNDHCQHQIYRVGDAAWGTQFHPEANAQTVVDWVKEDPAELDRLRLNPEELVSTAQREEPALADESRQLMERFLAFAASRRVAS